MKTTSSFTNFLPSSSPFFEPKDTMKVAVIGGGVSGVSATWALNEHSNHEVHLFEANEYVGGHTNTVLFEKPGGDSKSGSGVMVDTGFIVFNKVTYPNFLNFLNYLQIKIIASDMSFSVSRSAILPKPKIQLPFFSSSSSSNQNKQRGEFEWAGATPISLFCQWSNLFNPSHWRMVWDIIRFNHETVESLNQFDKEQNKKSKGEQTLSQKFAKQSIGEWLKERKYSQSFIRNYLIPMAACIWSTPADRAFSDFPALTLIRFMHNHHLLQILDRPQWLTLQGGSKTYVERVLSKLPSKQLHKGNQQGKVVETSFDSSNSQWIISTADGKIQSFDRVIFASHADTTEKMLSKQFAKDQSDNKSAKKVQQCLRQFEFNQNSVILHSDEVFMPIRRSAWSAWNFICETKQDQNSSNTGADETDEDGVVLTYWMNLLQSLDEKKYGPILVTLNAPDNIASSSKVLKKIHYEHPIYTAKSVEAQKELKTLQGTWNGAHFAGAWTNYGFHEDGFSSGLRAAYALGATPPFEIRDAERTTAIRNSFKLSNKAVQQFEFVRSTIANPFLIILAPFVIWLALVLELIFVNLFNFHSLTEELFRIRFAWEPFLHPTLLHYFSDKNQDTINGKIKKMK